MYLLSFYIRPKTPGGKTYAFSWHIIADFAALCNPQTQNKLHFVTFALQILGKKRWKPRKITEFFPLF
jgi:hypothetical protein